MKTQSTSRYARVGRRRGFQQPQSTRFTLIELMISLTVLTILMLVLFQFVISTQRTWSLNESMRDMVDNQRTVIDIVGRDLNALVVSSLQDQAIALHIPDPDTEDFQACFVSSSTMNRGAASRLCEIKYRVKNRQLERMVVTSDNADWDFFDDTSTSNPPWVIQANTPYETVLHDGVARLDVEFFRKVGEVQEIMGPGTYFEMPDGAYVTLILFSPTSDLNAGNNPDPETLTSAQTFQRVFFLNKLIQE